MVTKPPNVTERELIATLVAPSYSPNVVLPNGDDAAVLRIGGALMAMSTDAFVEDVHFSREYFGAADIGRKVVEATASDVVAVGGLPQYLVVALGLPARTDGQFVEQLYVGIREASLRIGAEVVGGDLSRVFGAISLAVTCVGVVPSARHLTARGGAAPGERICLSGPVGGSHAGLRAFQEQLYGFKEVKGRHLHPRCRVDLVETVAPVATSMIDVSDGLASELWLLAEATGYSFDIDLERIPFLEETRDVARALSENPLDYALGGGEDFQLLFTVPDGVMLPDGCVVIGRVGDEGPGVRRTTSTGFAALPRSGFDHWG